MKGVVTGLFVVVLTGFVSACGSGGLVSLRAAERAFDEAKIPFTADWKPTPANPYLAAKPAADNPTVDLPQRFSRHITGWAASINPRTYVNRTVYVFDGDDSAAAYGRWLRHDCICNGSAILTVRNIVYFGRTSPAVKSALAALAG